MNVAASTCDNNIISTSYFSTNTSGNKNDSGTGTLWSANLPTSINTSVSGATTHSNGVTTKQGSDASTTQTIAHGLGSAPSSVRFTILDSESTEGAWSFGAWDASGNHSIFSTIASNGTEGNSSTYSLAINAHNGAATLYQGGTVAVDATNITITWTKLNGGDAGVRQILWEAML